MRIAELKLFTADLEGQAEFYNKVLCLPIINRKPDHIRFRVGRTELVFEQFKGDEAPYYHFAINISENKIQQALKWLEDKVKISEDNLQKIIDFQSWNAHSIYFNDPAGNIVELIARHNLNNSSLQDQFTLDDIHGVDEIGLSFSDVFQAVEVIKRECKLPNWRPASSDFATLGDEDGLFIVVKEGRVWYMSDKPATSFPLEVSFLGLEDKIAKIGPYHIRSIQ